MIVPQFSKSTSSTAAALLPLLLFGSTHGQGLSHSNDTQTATGFAPCDALVAANLSHAVHFPSSPRFGTLVNGSYAIDARRAPWCFFQPRTTCEVSETITALRNAGHGAGDWHIAIRSGGHGGDSQSSIVNGVTIDLTLLNSTTYDQTTNVASVGTGARWGSVFYELEQHGVTVTGGREAVVGVGGLLLGGGVSWYSARTGFACDNVINYEVVLASGTVINANATAHPDLWRALKGGSSNFGIVTRFDLQAFPSANLDIERKTFDEEHYDEVIDAVAGFAALDQSYSDNALLAVMSYSPQTQQSLLNVTQVNTLNKANNSAFNAFNRIPTLSTVPTIHESISLFESANRSTSLSSNFRNAGSGAITIIADPAVMRYALAQHAQLVTDMTALVGPRGFSTILDFQPFQSYLGTIGVQKGGNMLGLDRDMRPKILFVISTTLVVPNAEAVYPRAYQIVTAANERVKQFSRSVGMDNDFTYLAYADARQNPLGNYGEASVRHMKETARKYDKDGFFQRRVPGGFKIDRV